MQAKVIKESKQEVNWRSDVNKTCLCLTLVDYSNFSCIGVALKVYRCVQSTQMSKTIADQKDDTFVEKSS